MKIVMIGGGSFSWSPKLICDLLNEECLENSVVVIEDINLEAAEQIKAIGERLAHDNGKKIKFIATNNEDEAFRNADIVLITISTGGLETMRPDVEIPEKYGIFQSVGDTVGPGGWSRALRNVPVFAAWAQKIEKLCPNAFVLNYSNPMATLTGVFNAIAPSIRAIGLCHGPIGTKHYLAKILGVDVSRITIKVGGVNHFFWITEFTVDGQNGYGLLREKLAGAPLLKYDKSYLDPEGILETNHMVLSDIYQHFGYLTYVADNHTAEFMPGYLFSEKNVMDYKILRKSIQYRKDNLKKAIQHARDMAEGKIPIHPKSCEIAVEVMKTIRLGTTHTDIVNLPNIGQITNLPMGAVVETFGVISPNGFSPVAIGNLPETLQVLTEPHCRVQLMTLKAALTGNEKLAFEALMLDPLCRHLTPAQIRQMGEELIAANRNYLPQFS